MIARVAKWQTKLDKIDEGLKSWKEGVVPTAKLRKGFRSGYLLIDRKTGESISIGFWDSEKDAIDDERSGQYQKRVDIGKSIYKVPPVQKLYEVVQA